VKIRVVYRVEEVATYCKTKTHLTKNMTNVTEVELRWKKSVLLQLNLTVKNGTGNEINTPISDIIRFNCNSPNFIKIKYKFL
jgi:hypothetical protein